MIDNSKNRLHEVFFYGLYMDPEMLHLKNVSARHPRTALVEDYELRIGDKATLLRDPGKVAYGMVYSLTHEEINTLYWGSGLDAYAAKVLSVKVGDNYLPVLTCNLMKPPKEGESNIEYAEKLKQAMKKLGLPYMEV